MIEEKKEATNRERILKRQITFAPLPFSGEWEREKEKAYMAVNFSPVALHTGRTIGKMEQIPFYALQFNIARFVLNMNYYKNTMLGFTAIAVGMERMHPILPSSQVSP